jgi:hypothetical protein
LGKFPSTNENTIQIAEFECINNTSSKFQAPNFKTHTGKTSSPRPAGCISDQFPTRGIPTTSLCLAREVSTSHDKSLPCTRSLRLAPQVSASLDLPPAPTGAWARAHDVCLRREHHHRRMRGNGPMPCKYNSWRPCKQLTPTRALMLARPAARPSHRRHLCLGQP